MKKPEVDTLRVAYQVHHSQLGQKRQKIHSMSTGAIGVFLLIAGWILSSTNDFTIEHKLLITICISVLLVITEINLFLVPIVPDGNAYINAIN